MKKMEYESYQTIVINTNFRDCIKEISNLEGYKLSRFYEILLKIGLQNFKSQKYEIDTDELNIGVKNEDNYNNF